MKLLLLTPLLLIPLCAARRRRSSHHSARSGFTRARVRGHRRRQCGCLHTAAPGLSRAAARQILDFLFKPRFGAGFQHLKVEIGSGENSTCGSEPSHVVTREELADPKPRGYEFWLMAEARKRNPQIILDCLPWAYPHWVGQRFSQESADWFATFLEVARKHYGLELDWIAAAQNEMGTDLNWIRKKPPSDPGRAWFRQGETPGAGR